MTQRNGAVAEDLEATNFFHSVMPYTQLLDVRVLCNSLEQVRARLAWAERLCTTGGVLHGGVIMSLADSVGAACALLNLPPGATGTTTVESKTNFLRAAGHGYVEAVATPVHCGRTLIVVETVVRDERDRLVAKVTQTQLVIGD
ncbi:MAG TPA: PaaI family thioesterase [Pseudonocardia sp.]|jgi:uncharacterized protein (TIGR00369 family)|uniref:PaaI family thioesterase n=1 Tax=Pseudonocardia sp. TaxID=60912 RepID=UPI002F40A9B5